MARTKKKVSDLGEPSQVEPDDERDERDARLDRISTMMETFFEQALKQQNEPRRQPEYIPPPPPPPPLQAPIAIHPLEPLYERFRKQGPPVFEGNTDPLVAEEWMRSMETIFEFMQLNDHEKVSCATYMLKKDARYWWDIIRQSRAPAQMLWTEFQTLFNNKYYSTAVK